MRFPKLNVRPQSREFIQEFGGLDRRPRISENCFSETGNLTGDFYPALAPRRKRGIVGTMEHCNALLTAGEKMACVRGNTLYWGDEAVLELNAGEEAQRQLVMMGAYIVVFPDQMYFNTADAADSGMFSTTNFKSSEQEMTFSVFVQKDASQLPQDEECALSVDPDSEIALTGSEFWAHSNRCYVLHASRTFNHNSFAGSGGSGVQLTGIPNPSYCYEKDGTEYYPFGDYEIVSHTQDSNGTFYFDGKYVRHLWKLSQQVHEITIKNKRTGETVTHKIVSNGTNNYSEDDIGASVGYWLRQTEQDGTPALYYNGEKINSVVRVSSSKLATFAKEKKLGTTAALIINKGDAWCIPYLEGLPNEETEVCFSGGYMWVQGSLCGGVSFTTVSKNEAIRDNYTTRVNVRNSAPDMDYVIESQNRLWGCRYGPDVNGDFVNEIYASALGDFQQWYTFSGVSTDSYVASVGLSGPFTGAVNYRGFPLFFKENVMYKVYGDYPANYQIVADTAMGVQKGCDKSLFVLSGVLYYKSPDGIFAYNGSSGERIDAVLGSEHYAEVVCCGTGTKLWLSMVGETDAHSGFYVCDTEKGLWHKEDGTVAQLMARFENDVYVLDKTGRLFTVNGSAGEIEGDETSFFAQTGIIGYNTPDSKYVSRLALRVAVPHNATLRIYIEYDSANVWEFKGSIEGNGMRTFPVPVVPRLCDHFRIRLEGKGDCRIFGFSKVLEEGGAV